MAVFSGDLLFVHIPKTGGWSCKTWLRANVPNIAMPEDHDNPFPIGHIPLRDVERFSGRSPDSFERIIAVVRNPYEQQLSQWLFWRDRYARGGRHPHDHVAAMYPDLTHWLLDPQCDFHVWYEEQITGTVKTTAERFGYQDFGGFYRYWLGDDDGAFPDHLHIIEFDRIADDLPAACAPFAKPDPGPFPHHNAGPKRGPTHEYYTALAAQLVEQKFGWAFESRYPKYARDNGKSVPPPTAHPAGVAA